MCETASCYTLPTDQRDGCSALTLTHIHIQSAESRIIHGMILVDAFVRPVGTASRLSAHTETSVCARARLCAGRMLNLVNGQGGVVQGRFKAVFTYFFVLMHRASTHTQIITIITTLSNKKQKNRYLTSGT